NSLFCLAAAAIFALSVIFLGSSINNGLKSFNNNDRSVVMKGLAQRDVKADLALWTISYTETGNNLPELQELMESRGRDVVDFLRKNGISGDAVTLNNVSVQDLMAQSYRQNNAVLNRYILTQSYLVRTNDIESVNKASKNIGELIKKGIVFAQRGSNQPTYIFTGLNDIKPEMIAEATENAREGAEQFAENSGQEVGSIKRASQGVFQILPRDQTFTIPEAQQINKTVRVVSTITFDLED
ncbi:MAG: SIMPL domain-containing protein, partial [Pseudomonadota bacterium]